MLLVVEACVWREVKVAGVGNVASLFSARAFVWGDVDPHGGGLGAGEPDGGAVVVKIRAPAVRRCLYALDEGSGMPMRVKKFAA